MGQRSLSNVSEKARIGNNVRMYSFVNIYGDCEVGDDSVIGAFVEIQPGVRIGKRVKISSHVFICTGVVIEDDAFIGHGVMFTNDKFPQSVNHDGEILTAATTQVVPTYIRRKASIGSNVTVLCGTTVNEGALVGAGSVVTNDVPAHTIVYGVPARVAREM